MADSGPHARRRWERTSACEGGAGGIGLVIGRTVTVTVWHRLARVNRISTGHGPTRCRAHRDRLAVPGARQPVLLGGVPRDRSHPHRPGPDRRPRGASWARRSRPTSRPTAPATSPKRGHRRPRPDRPGPDPHRLHRLRRRPDPRHAAEAEPGRGRGLELPGAVDPVQGRGHPVGDPAGP